jgi:hypothetical protein
MNSKWSFATELAAGMEVNVSQPRIADAAEEAFWYV